MMARSAWGIAAVLAICAGCAPVAGGPSRPAPYDPAPRFINPGTLAALDGFTHAVKVGTTIYISGEVPLDSTGELVGRDDLAAQARQAFANLAFVLHIAGANPADVVKLNVYVVNYRPGDLDVIRKAGAEFFPERNPPAGTVLGVASLPGEGMLIAVDAVAQMRGLFEPRRRGPR
jgi:enamine deaminase RidA (YjgF/YER057c/UK114 family)